MPTIQNSINSVVLPNSTAYTIVDSNALHLLGVTTTSVTEGSTTAEVTIGGNNVTAIANDVVLLDSNNAAFRFDGTAWHTINADAVVPPIQSITVNGTEVTPSEYTVALEIPTISVNKTTVTPTNHNVDIAVPITSVSVNGTSVTPDNHNVDVTVPITGITVNNATVTPSAEHIVNITVPVGPMTMKGTLSDGDVLPTAAVVNLGWCYRVVEAGTYDSQVAKVGDVFVCCETANDSFAWVIIPAGDDIDVQSVAVGAGLHTNNAQDAAITSSGTISLALKSAIPLTTTANTTSDEAGKTYPVALSSDGYLGVNVPWTDTTSIPITNVTGITTNGSASAVSNIATAITAIGTSTPSETASGFLDDLFTVTSGVLTIKQLTNTTSAACVATAVNNIVQTAE